MQRRSIILPITCILLMNIAVHAATTRTPVEKLVEKLPHDTLGFLATSGGDTLKPDFDKSALGKIWHEPSVQTFYQQMKDQVQPLIQNNFINTKDKRVSDILMRLAKAAFSCPVVIAVCERPGAKENPIYGFLLADVGNRKTDIEAAFNELEATDPKNKAQIVTIDGFTMHKGTESEAPGYLWGFIGNHLLFAVNDPDGGSVRLLAGKSPVTQPVTLNELTGLPGTDDTAVLYLDARRIGRLVATEAEKEPNGRAGMEKVRRALSLLGLREVRSLAVRLGFDGTNMVGDAVLNVPEPRAGLFSLVKPINEADLNAIPANVTQAEVFNGDLAGLYDLVLNTVKDVLPEETEDLDQTIADFEQKAGFRIRDDLLASIGGPVIMYSLPATNPLSVMVGGGIVQARITNPARFEKAMTALETCIADNTDQVQITTQPTGDRTIHMVIIPQLAMLQFTPAWTVCGDRLIFATNQELVRTALKTLDGPTLAAKVKNLPKDLIELQYADQRAQTLEGMQALQQMWPMLAMLLQKENKIKLPMILPPAEEIARHMGDGVAYTWFTPQGIRFHSHGSGPGTNSSLTVVAGTSLGVAILLPALSRAREMAKRSVSASNMRQIFLACNMYAGDHKGKFPADLQELIKEKMLPGKMLPDLRKSPLAPSDFDGPGYIYVSGLDADADPRWIVLYENPGYSYEGLNVCYGDGHVAWTKPDTFKTQLADTYKVLDKPMPEIKFAPSRKTGLGLNGLFGQGKTGSNTGGRTSGVNLDKNIPFKCVSCGNTVHYTIRELQEMQKPGEMGPTMGPMKLDCPKCKKKELTQAVECPKCAEIFVMKMDPDKGLFDDKCPKCGESYAKAWQEKYRKEHEK